MRKLIFCLWLIFLLSICFVLAFDTSNIVACFDGSNMTDYYHHVGDLTNNGIQLATAGCKIGNECWNGSSVDNANYINGQNGSQISFSFNLTSGTVMWWAKTRSMIGSGISNTMWGGIDGVSCTAAGRFSSYIDPTANHIYMLIGNGANGDTGYTVPFNVWQHYAVRWNDSKFQFFVNGTSVYTLNSFNGWNSNDYRVTGACSYEFFRFLNTYNGGEPYGGIIDEWSLWNRSLTNAEISDAFTSSVSCSFIQDAIPPQVSISTNNTSPKYNANVSIYVNSTEAGNCWVYNNMSNTNSSLAACNATFTYIINLTKTKSILFRAYATDSYSNLNNSEYVIINTINSAPPSTNNFNVSNDYTASTNETINFTAVTDADGDTINYYVWWNDSIPRIIANTTLNKFTLNLTTQGVFYYWVETFDGTASGGNSSVQQLTADFTPPTITWTSPSSATTYTFNIDYLVNVTCSDNYEIWSMNISIYNSSNANLRSIYIENVSAASYNNASIWNLSLYQSNKIRVRCYDSHTDAIIPDLKKGKKGQTVLIFNDSVQDKLLIINTYFVEKLDKFTDTPGTYTSTMDYMNADNQIVSSEYATKIKFGGTFTVLKPETKIVYNLSSNVKLNYLPQSQFSGHIIWFPYVTDFSTADFVYVNGFKQPSITTIKVIDDYHIQVKIQGLTQWSAGDIITIDPETQGLNLVEQNRTINQMSYPYWNNLQNNASSNTKLNGYINWSVMAYDRDNNFWLSDYTFYHNSSGAWQNINKAIYGLNSVFINVTTQVTSPHYVCGYFIITDLYGLTNTTDYSCANITNSIPTIPILSLPANNSLQTSNYTLFDWSDSTDADSDSITYNLLVSNASDLSYVWFNKTGLISSTYTLTNNQSLSDGQYYWVVNSTDSYGYSNYSLTFTYIINTTFGVAAQTKNCTVCYANEDIIFNTTINGASIIGTVIFSENSTGAWVNYTSGFINSTDWYAYKINGTNYQRFEMVGWYWWVNSTDNRISVGALQIFNISNHIPTQSIPIINVTNVSNLLLSNLTCSPNNVSDLEGDSISFSYVWYKNYINQSAFNNVQKLTPENINQDDIWICQVSIYDGYDYGITKNSTGLKILNYLPSNNYLFMFPYINYTYNLEIPKYSYASNFSFYLVAYNSTDICYQENTNQSPQCQFYNTFFANYNNGVTTYGVNNTPFPNNGSDGDHNSYIAGYTEPFKTYGMIEEYKTPKVPIILELDTGDETTHCRKNISVGVEYVVNNTLGINIIYQSFSLSLAFFGYNGTAYKLLYNTVSNPCGIGNTWVLYETAIYQNLTSSGITNFTISTYDNEILYFNNSILYDSQNHLIDLNATIINNVLKSNCSCYGCIASIPNCTIPLKLTSASVGRLNIYNYSITTDFELNNCTGSSIPSNATALNISFYDNAGSSDTIIYEATTFYTDGIGNKNISIASSGLNNIQYCIYPNWAQLRVNQHNNYYDGTNYYNYYLNNNLFSNATQQLNLYTQNGTTQVLFTVQNKNSEPVANAYLHILAYDVGTGTYQTTEILQTDTKGQALGNIVLYNTFYTFLIYSDNNLVYAENGVRVIANTRTFTISLAGTVWTDDFVVSGSVSHDLYFNNATNNFVFTYSDSSSTMHYGCLRVDKINRTGSYNLSDDCLYSASGSVITTIIPSNDTTYIATGYIKFDNEFIKDVLEVVFVKPLAFFHTQEPGLMLFLAIIIWISLFLIGLPHPAVSLAMFGIAMVVTSLLGLYMISGTMLVGIIFLALVQMYLMNRQQ